MLDTAKKSWAELKRGTPGKRFEQRYRRKNPGGRRSGRNTAVLALGLLVLAVGLFFLAVPGPGIPIVVVGAGMVAQGSRVVARLLDWIELRIRAVLGWTRRVWQAAGSGARAAIVLAGVALAAAGAYAGWWFFFER
jgi:hypothetical protein